MSKLHPEPLTVAYAVAFLQTQILKQLKGNFPEPVVRAVVGTLTEFVRPAVQEKDDAAKIAIDALTGCREYELDSEKAAKTTLLFLALLREHLPTATRAEILLLLNLVLAAAGDDAPPEAAKLVELLSGSLEVGNFDFEKFSGFQSLTMAKLVIPAALIERVLPTIPNMSRDDTDVSGQGSQDDADASETEPDVAPASSQPQRPETAVDLQSGADTGGAIHLGVKARRILGYAMVAAGIPVVDAIEVANPSDSEVEELVVTVRVTCAMQDAPIATFVAEIRSLEPRQGLRIPLRELRPEPRVLVQLDEAVVGGIEATVEQAGQTVARVALPLRVLSYNQWCEVADCYELLAAHVMPNHPALVRVRQTASELLQSGTGQSSQEGYQSGAKRALEIAAATYAALQNEGIHYSNPPAASEARQKIRTPEQVLVDKFGTCLDTACLMAAALEQAGLHAAIFVVRGHAFAGLFVNECSLRTAAVRDADVVRNLVEARILVPIETTTLCETRKLPFDEAVAQARRVLFSSPFEALIAINDARVANIRPLPSRIVADGQVVIVQQEATATGEPVVLAPRRVQAARATTEPMPPRLRKWQSDLLDLSLRNPLLNIKIGRGGGVRLVSPPGALHNVERALAAEGESLLVAHDELTALQRARGAHLARDMAKAELASMWNEHQMLYVEVEAKALRTRLRQLMNQARSMEEESGANILHLSIGSVVWTDPDKDKRVRSPLLTIPVRIDMKARGKPPRLIADLTGGGTSVNQCLLQKLKQTFRFEAPAAVVAWRGDKEDADIRAVFEAMRTAFAKDLPEATIEEDATLCMLHFGKFRMWKDLQEHWPEFMRQPVVQHLVERPGQQYNDPVPLPKAAELESGSAYCPIPIDGSQLEAVVAAARGSSFVLEGPPGTGKSQTITNLIANALAAGKKVLFVAEKRAALEVVKHRLDKVGLGAYCLDIHGKASKPKDLCAQLIKSHDAQFTTDLPAFEKLRKELNVEAEELRSYAQRLHERNALGQSLWSAHQASLAVGDGFTVPAPPSLFANGLPALVALRDGLRDLDSVARNAELAPRHAWGMVATAEFEALATPELTAALAAMAAAYDGPLPGVDAAGAAALDGIAMLSHLRGVAALTAARADGYSPTLESLRSARTVAPDIWQLHEQAHAVLDRRLATARLVLHDHAFAADLRQLAEGIEKAQDAFFLWRRGKVRAAVAAVQPLIRGAAPAPKVLVAALRDAAAVVAAAKELADTLRRQSGLSLPAEWSALAADAPKVLAAAMTAAREASPLAGTSGEPALAAVLAVGNAEAPALQAALAARAEAWRLLAHALRCDDAAMQRWLEGRTLTQAVEANRERWHKDANGDFLGLIRWCKLQAKLAPLDAADFGAIRTATLTGAISPAQVIEVIDRSVARACVAERRKALGFQRFDGKEHSTRVQHHAALHADESKALAEVLPVKLLGTRPFGPGERKGVVGELRRKDLERARPRSIRALLDEYADAVLALTPCVLASPDSVAQFLVPGVIEFDLVVFDEASQVPVADAIGAIGRGKAVVVVGDSQQMPPTSFFTRTSTAASDDEAPVEDDTPDMDSILTEARNDGIKPILLSWHYRSQDESLIAFSNRHYYDSRLSSFPAPMQQSDGKGLMWIKVADGVFDSAGGRINEREADTIVSEVRRRLADPVESRRSLGIVTMNLTQAELVRDRLEAAAENDPVLRTALEDESEDRLFVKNLENVQGDERDVIVIGMTYGKGPDGRMRMQFGPLGKAGGEKRWNVLVTRARQQVVVISSMEPEDIRTHDVSASATGVHHMRAYLEMCKRGVGASLESRLRPVEEKDLHREDVAAALRKRRLHVETNIGLSSFKIDLAVADVADPSRRLVAVLLDGPSYAARRTVQDRDALPVSVLQRMMGWPKVVRVWLPEWLLERDRVTDEIVAACAEARDEAAQKVLLRAANVGRAANAPVTNSAMAAGFATFKSRPTEGSAQDSPPFTSERPVADLLREVAAANMSEQQIAAYERALDATEAKVQPAPVPVAPPTVVRDPLDLDFVPYEDESLIGQKEDVAEDASGAAHQRMRVAIDAVLRCEAPIESTRLAKLVARRFGLQRVREDRVRVVLSLVDRGLMHHSELGTFVWRRDMQPATWRAFRRTAEEHARLRTFDLVAPEEARNALVHCATKGMGLSDDGAIEELKTVFAVGKSSQDFRDRAQTLIEWSLATGALVRDAKGRLQPKDA
jgi:hypothetical protein